MSKFATILLKIIMVISFVAIIVFVAFAVITNQNISFEAYNYISSTHSETDFDDLENKVNANLRTAYNKPVDQYAKFINKAISELNDGNELFLNYLSVEDRLTKGEQDRLRYLYKDYNNKFKASKKAYDDYIVSYEEADYQYNYNYSNSSVALSMVVSKCVYFVQRYTDCYRAGSEYFKYLVKIVNKYSFDNQNCFSFEEQTYLIKVGIVDYSTSTVYENMAKKKENADYETVARNNEIIDCFYDFCENENDFSDENLVTDSEFQLFVFNLNDLNIYEFSGNYDNYLNSLKKEETISKCQSAHEFFVSNFRGWTWKRNFYLSFCV